MLCSEALKVVAEAAVTLGTFLAHSATTERERLDERSVSAPLASSHGYIIKSLLMCEAVRARVCVRV